MRHLIGGLTAAAALLIVGVVAAMTVQPVVVDMAMTGRAMSSAVRVENNGPNPLPVEIRIVETNFAVDAVGASDRPSEDVMVFPPQSIIPPGETQVFRLQYIGDPGADRSKHYYAEVAQLPVELPAGQSAIQILYNFQVMVNVASTIGTPPVLTIESTEVVQNAEGKNMAAFTVKNAGTNYGYLSAGSLTIRHTDAAGNETVRRTLSGNEIQQMIGFGLIGPEMTRRFVSPVEVGSADGRVEATLQMPRGR